MRGTVASLSGILMGVAASVAVAEGSSIVVIPETTYVLDLNASHQHESTTPKDDLVRAISAWISAEFDMPPATQSPTVKYATKVEMIAIRYRATNPNTPVDPAARNARSEAGHEIVALYDDRDRTIYLGEGWTGGTPADFSVLVHEVVHHLQKLSDVSFACAGEREKLAYQAQSRFLALFDQTLESAFDVDPMTLLVRTTCAM